MTTETRGQREPGSGLSLNLDYTLNKSNLQALATVTFRKKHAPSEPLNVIFVLIGHDSQVEETDESGRTQATFTLPAPGNYRLVAYLEVEPGNWKSKAVVYEEPPKKEAPKPGKLTVRVVGPLGSQKLLITVAEESGKSIPNFKGLIVNNGTPSEFTTDNFGMFVFPTDIPNGDKRAIRVRVSDGPGLEWAGVLIGG